MRPTTHSTTNLTDKKHDRAYFSAAGLRRLLKSLPSGSRWSALRMSQQALVESLRRIAEVVIWGDQNDAAVFTVFHKEDALDRILRLLRRKANRRGPVAIQLLQTFGMFIQNIRNKTSLAYLLNHEATRLIISTEFDFRDEDVLAHYVVFVKSISFNLDASTVTSFTKRVSHKSDIYSMPLFSEAAKFIDSPERMVRSAARTLTLTIMSMKNEGVDRFLTGHRNQCFFRNQVHNLGLKVDELAQLRDVTDPDKRTLLRMSCLSVEIEDVICYLNDVYMSGSKTVQMELANAVWDELLGHYLILPLFEEMNKQLKCNKGMQPMSEEGYPLLQVPKAETLINIASEWRLFQISDTSRTQVTTFVANTMNVLLRRSDFIYSRVIMQLINQAFNELDKSAQQRLIPLVNIDLETLDLNEDPEWRIEATKMDTKTRTEYGSSLGLLEIADYIGLPNVLDVLKTLFLHTKCEKYRPSPLLVALAKNPKAMFKGKRFIPFNHSAKNRIKVASSQKPVHQRFGSLRHFPSLRDRRRYGSF